MSPESYGGHFAGLLLPFPHPPPPPPPRAPPTHTHTEGTGSVCEPLGLDGLRGSTQGEGALGAMSPLSTRCHAWPCRASSHLEQKGP